MTMNKNVLPYNDTYDISNYRKKLGRACSEKVRKCLRCEKDFLSKDDTRTCQDCRHTNSQTMIIGEGVRSARRH